MVDRLILVGMMGAGKTTVGRLLADRLGWRSFDSDRQIMEDTGHSVPELFAERGEAAFRAEEERVLTEALSGDEPVVVSAAGGVVLSPSNRELLTRSGTVVWLRADPVVLARRVGDGAGRPLLDDDPASSLVALYEERRPWYDAVATLTVDVDALTPEEVVERILGGTGLGAGTAPVRVIPVDLAERGYEVVVGHGARHRLAELVAREVPGATRAAVVTQAGIGVEVDPGLPVERFTVPDGEEAKSLAVVEELCRGWAQAGISRADVIVAVGGGVVTDLTGFAAASFHRGTAYVNVATTLLGQVDAAVGGKTGVNLPEGKNLVGSFWQPRAVLCDTEVLATLPPREWASGRGEMAKYAFLGDLTGQDSEPDASLLELPLDEQVARCVAIKAGVVTADEREGDLRMLLNYGHTLAHALEATAFDPGAGWDLRHGEAVAIGLVFAGQLARRLGRIDDRREQRHRTVVGGFDLSPLLPHDADPERLTTFMERDKKAHHDLTFVLDGPEGVEVVHGVDRAAVVATLAAMDRTEAGTSA